MGLGSCLCSDFSFSPAFQLLLGLPTLFPRPTFAPSSGEPFQQLFLTFSSTKVSWIRCGHLWIHHICKVCYSGTFHWDPYRLIMVASFPDICHIVPRLHNEETGCKKNLPTVSFSHLSIQHDILRRRLGVKWEPLSRPLCHPDLPHLPRRRRNILLQLCPRCSTEQGAEEEGGIGRPGSGHH